MGEVDRMGFFSQWRLGEAESPLPQPHLLAPGNSGENRPCREPGRQALRKGRPCASLLFPHFPPTPCSRPPRTQMGRGFQGLSPTVYAGLQGKKFKHHHNSKEKSSKWIQALLAFSLLLGLLHGSYSSMLDHETFAYTSSLMSLL